MKFNKKFAYRGVSRDSEKQLFTNLFLQSCIDRTKFPLFFFTLSFLHIAHAVEWSL